MKRTIKLCLLVCLAMLVCTLVLTACVPSDDLQTPDESTQGTTEPDPSQGQLAFELNADGSGYIVTGIGTYSGTELVIPAEHEGLPVTGIADQAFKSCMRITALHLPENIRVGDWAFAGCTGLTQVTIPKGTTGLYYAFEACSGLESATLESLMDSWGIFANCDHLKHLEFGSDVLIDLTRLGEIHFLVDDPEQIPADAQRVEEVLQEDENGEVVYDQDGRPIVLRYRVYKNLPIESITGGVLGAAGGPVGYANLTRFENYTLAEGFRFINGALVGPITLDYGETRYNLVWVPDTLESLVITDEYDDLLDGNKILYNLSHCKSLKALHIPVGYEYLLEKIPNLTDLYYEGTILDCLNNADRLNGLIAKGCAVHCSDGDISAELGAALLASSHEVFNAYLHLGDTYAPFLGEVAMLELYWYGGDDAETGQHYRGYKDYLDTGIDYEAYAEYVHAEEGTGEYNKYQEYLEFRTARSRYNTTRNRRLNDVVNMYMYLVTIRRADVAVQPLIDEFTSVHLPVLLDVYGCTLEYEQGQEGNLGAIANYDELPERLQGYLSAYTRYMSMMQNDYPTTVDEAQALYDAAEDAVVEPGYITREEIENRIVPVA